ncbi:MAG: hypothetical protein GY928_25160 [Colwellia sp.]|nr:hypothetical protein [Colwellia sp.]
MITQKKEEIVSISYRLRDELAALRHQILLSDSMSKVKATFNTEFSQEHFWPLINRYIYTSLTITLNKMMELYEKYQYYIPEEAREKLKKAYKCFLDVGVKTYRNDYCGHIQNKNSKKTISDIEVDQHLLNIVGNRSLHEIGQWIWDASVDDYEKSTCLSGLLESVARETEKSIN